MIDIIRSSQRGDADLGWLKSKHTFSFGDYYNPDFMGFGSLRVINEDRVQPTKGFGTHGHKDMEIISYVLDGSLEHKDSMGNGSAIRVGDLQRMTAGTGVMHSEFNPSESDEVHFLQIWILPEKNSLEPGYEQKSFSNEEKSNRWKLLGSRNGRDGSVTIHQDVDLYATIMDDGRELTHSFAPGRKGWLQVARGKASVDGTTLLPGDATAVDDVDELSIRAIGNTELLLFDMR